MDLDQDGRRDVLSGSWPGEIHLFRGLEDGTLAAPATIRGPDEKPLKTDSASVAFAYDWDGDGKLDLVLGNIKGEVFVARNATTEAGLAFAAPERLEADGQPLRVQGDSGPCVADWDGDGKADLLVGSGDGAVLWYHNVGEARAPRLAAGVELVAPASRPRDASQGSEAPSPCGMRTKVAVADWNGDGRPDLLVGDFRSVRGEAPELDETQQAEKARLEQESEAARERLTSEIGRIREAAAEELEGATPEAIQARMVELLDGDADVKAAQEALKGIFEKLRAFQAQTTFHGHVHAFLRAAPKASEEASR